MLTPLDQVTINFSTDALWGLNIALALVMYGVAMDISPSDFKQLLFRPKPIIVGLLSQFILLPLVTFMLIWILKPSPSIALGMILVAVCPGGNISNFMTHLAGGNNALSVSLTAFATVLAIFFVPFNLELWGGMYPPTATLLKKVALHPMDIFWTIVFLLIVPLIFGMLTRYYAMRFVLKVAPYFKVGSIFVFVLLVILAFINNLEIFFSYIHYVFALVLVHNALAVFSGFSIAKLTGLSTRNTKTIAIETGIQNSGLGLLLIFTFFEGLGGMALVTAFGESGIFFLDYC